MIEIKELKIEDGEVSFKAYIGFGQWKSVQIERTEYGYSSTSIDSVLDETNNDEVFDSLEEIINGFGEFVLNASLVKEME